ncbi:unnamed protein product [Linum trigynum]|uniref:Uncharacterized protein n=1 Tax=Linum trigynum TaxID=586398 RepID=A0AAV2FXY6_9ROSI
MEAQDAINRDHEAALEHLRIDVGQLQRGQEKLQDGQDRLSEEINVVRVEKRRLANDVSAILAILRDPPWEKEAEPPKELDLVAGGKGRTIDQITAAEKLKAVAVGEGFHSSTSGSSTPTPGTKPGVMNGAPVESVGA